MAFAMLFAPQLQQQWRHLGENGDSPMHLRVTAGHSEIIKRNNRLPRHPMMDDDRAFIPTRGIAPPAPIASRFSTASRSPPPIQTFYFGAIMPASMFLASLP